MCYNELYIEIWEEPSLNTQEIASQLLHWYALHFRPLPWRQKPTPYHVWVSEIMLQQTRIEAVLPYYRRFVEALPTIADLAEAPSEVLLKLWEGLGYYSRVRNMQKAAQRIMSEYGGELPADYDALLALPGIGPYTAGAIASIAFNIPVPAVDGNVMRVLARLTADDTDVLSTAGKNRFTALAWEMVPEREAGRYNQALMELGETVCVPNGPPKCHCCPLSYLCEGLRLGCAEQLPIRVKKVKRRVEQRQIALVCVETVPRSVLLHKRADSGLLAGLWELPNTLSADPIDSLPPELRDICTRMDALPSAKHLFSHIEWRMNGSLFAMPPLDTLPCDYVAVNLAELQKAYPLPGAFRAYTTALPQLLCEER